MHRQRHWRRYLEVVVYKSYSTLKIEASRAYLGVLWWVIEPVVYMATFYLIFGAGIRQGGVEVVPFLFCGLINFRLFSGVVRAGSNSIRANMNLMEQVYLPKYLFPLIVLFSDLIRYLIIFSLLLVFLLLYGYEPTAAWLSLPIMILVLVTFSLAVATVLAAIIPYLPDLKLVVGNTLTILFFMSGIMFDINQRSEAAQAILRLNPMVGVLDNFRTILLDGTWPDWLFLGWLSLFSVALLVLGFVLLRRLDHTYLKLAVG